MGRGKIEIKKIENVNSRQVTFSKRRSGLLKKAHELGVLCDAEVAVIIFSNTGKLFQYANRDMKQTFSRYNEIVDSSDPTMVESKEEEPKEVDILREEIEKLKVQQLHLLGKDLSDLGLKELQLLEKQLIEGLLSVKERKERLLIGQIEHSRKQEQRAMLENVTLRKQVQQLRNFFPPSQCSVPPFPPSYPLEGNNSIVKHDAISADTSYNTTTEDGNSENWLKLGFSSEVSLKRKTPETRSENQDGTL